MSIPSRTPSHALPSGVHTPYNYGGFDADNCGYGSRACVDVFDPSTGTDLANKDYSSGVDKNGNPGHQPTPDCTGVTQFRSRQTGKLTTFSRTAVTSDAKYRALQTATAMRTENPGMLIYSIGLGIEYRSGVPATDRQRSGQFDVQSQASQWARRCLPRIARRANALPNCSKSSKPSPLRFFSGSPNEEGSPCMAVAGLQN